MNTKTPSRIGCPRTGRTWPAVRRADLKACTSCGGVIDTRVEAWHDGPGALHVVCPPALAADPPPVAADSPKVLATSAWDWPRDDAHDEAMRRLQAAQETTAAP